MFMLVLSGALPSIWRRANAFTEFFLEHPSDSTNAQYMNVYDIGVPAFFFIIGLLMAVSFKKRVEKSGTGDAVLNAVIRWGLITVIGVLFMLIPVLLEGDPLEETFGVVKEIAPGVDAFVVRWDVVISLGFVGLACIPFLLVPVKWRLVVSYAMMAFYQVMIFIPGTLWREYAKASVHGGILGSIFVLVPLTLVSTAVGEFFILDKDTPPAEKNRKFLLLGAINLAIGIALWLIPGGFPSKRQSTMAWATISLAVCVAVSYVLIKVDYTDDQYPSLHPVNKARVVLFNAYGMNPFLIYAIYEIVVVVVRELVAWDFETQLVTWLVLMVVVTMLALFLYKKNKAISTTKVALVIIIIVVVLAVVLLPLL